MALLTSTCRGWNRCALLSLAPHCRYLIATAMAATECNSQKKWPRRQAKSRLAVKLKNVSGSSALISNWGATQVTRDALHAPRVARRDGAGMANTYLASSP